MGKGKGTTRPVTYILAFQQYSSGKKVLNIQHYLIFREWMKHEKGATRGLRKERVLPGGWNRKGATRQQGKAYLFFSLRKKNAEYSALLDSPGMEET